MTLESSQTNTPVMQFSSQRFIYWIYVNRASTGADPGFQVRGGGLKKSADYYRTHVKTSN
jgi:hypothetical protein